MRKGRRIARRGLSVLMAVIMVLVTVLGHLHFEAEHVHAAEDGESTATGTFADGVVQEGIYYIKNVKSGKYMQVKDGSASSGKYIQQGTFTGKDAQKFKIVSDGNGYYYIMTGTTDYAKCIDIDDDSKSNDKKALQSTYEGADAQKFRIELNDDGTFAFLTEVSDYKSGLQIYNASTSEDANVVQYTYSGNDEQKWIIETTMVSADVKEGEYFIKNVNSGLYLDVELDSAEHGADIQQWKFDGSVGQRFKIVKVGDYYAFKTAASDYANCMDVLDGSVQNGADVRQYAYFGGDMQLFKIVVNTDGSYSFLSKISNGLQAVEVFDNGKNSGNNVGQWGYWGGATQKWVLEAYNDGSAEAPISQYKHIFDEHGENSDFYIIDGNLSSDKGSCKYDGKTYKKCLKLESSTKVTFTAPATGTLTLVFGGDTDAGGQTILVDGKEKSIPNDEIFTIELSAGNHTIQQDEKQLFVYVMVYDITHVHEYTSSATTAPTCTTKGVRTYVCACGEGSYTEVIQEIGHIYSEEFTVDEEATESTDGSKSRHCMVQGCSSKIDVTVIPATGGGSGSGSGEGSGEVSKYEHIFAVHGIDSEFYTIDGNLSKSKGSATYNGTNYSTCLKVESETLITFTADKKGTLELVFGGNTSAAGKTILVDGNAYVVDATQTLVLELAAGNHTIEQDEEQIFMYAMVYTVGEGSGAGGGSGEGSRYEHIFAIEGKECANDFFTITGNLSKEDAFTYNGTEYGKSYDKNCLKIESDTSISFTAGTAGTLELYFGDSDSAVGEQIKIDGTSYELDANKKVTVELEAGNHTITKDDSVMLYVMVFSTGEVHEHVYASKVTTAATCEAKGVRTFTCACGDTKTEDIPATGHNYDKEYTIDVEPTEVATGEKSRHCLNEGCNSRTDITVLSKISKGGTKYEHIFERDRVTSDFYSFNTTALTTKYGNIVYEGETYGVALKLQRATKIKFTAEYPGTLTLGFNSSSAGNEITIDGEIYDLSENLVITVELGAGEHVIMKETGESYLFYMVYETEVIVNEGDVHVHSYTSEITKAATCTEEGVKTYTCSCGDTYTTNMAALGHTYEVRVIEPTCTATGSSTYTCIFCEDEYTNELPATGHAYTAEVTTEPTCTAEGVRTYTCSDCGDSYTEAVAMVPHDYESTYTVDVQPTANTTGSMSRHCKNCDAKTDITVLPAGTGGSGGGSKYVHIFEIDGKDSDFYTIIGDNLADSKGTVEYEGKTYETALKVNSNMSVSFTATTKGTLTLGFCSTCAGNKISVDGTEYTLPEGGVFTIELEAGDHTILRVKNESYLYYMVFEEAGSSHTHDYTSSVTKVPTCAEEGVTTYVCLCGHSYTEPIAMVDHDYEDAYTIDVKATTKTEGSKSRHCKNCDARTDVTVIPVITIENMEDEIIFENGSPNESYESIDVTWILESPDDAIVTLIYTTTGDKYPGCIVMNWGAQVDDQWNIGNTYSAGNPSDSVVTITMTVAELKESLGITEGSKVDYVTLSTYNNGTIIRLSVSGDGNLDDSGDIHIHVYSSSITKQVTCTENGQITYSCECGAAYMEPIVATGHVAGTPAEEGRVDATYEAPGYYYMVTRCTKCSEELARVEHTLDKLICNNHNYNAGVITTPPTCTTTGIKTYTCGICNGTKTEEVEALGHSYNSGVVTTQPTCTATGVRTFTCGTCGHSYTESVAAKGHNYDNGVITTNPTCTTEGVKTFTCQNDNSHTYTQAVSAKGHTPGTAKEENRVEATCEGAGSYNMVTRCTECNAIITSVPHTIDAKGHTNGAAVQENRVEASCETDGSYQSVVYCEVCDKKLSSTTVSIPKTGHNYDKGVVTTKPTCTVAGVKTYTCQNNKAHTYTEAVEPLGHTRGAVQTENYKAPSYTANGSYDEVVYCTVCKQELERKSYVIPMNECATHQYTSQVTKEATCTETGTLKKTCTVCGKSVEETIAAKGHTDGTPVEEDRVEAKCETPGSYNLVTYCTVCKAETGSVSKTISATGHTEGSKVVENRVEETCEKDGSYDEATYCTVCKKELSRTSYIIDKTGHDYDSGVITTKPTCEGTGIRTFTCKNDGSHTYTEVVDATGHTETKGGTELCHSICSICSKVLSSVHGPYTDKVTKVASCTEKGILTHTCTCGYSYTEEIPKVAHTPVNGGTEDCHSKCSVCDAVLNGEHSFTVTVTKEAKCLETGENTHTCNCGYSYVTEIPATGHTTVNGGTPTAHTKCSKCGTILSAVHTYTDTETKAASCTQEGELTRKCACGYSYTVAIPVKAHTPVNGNAADCHSKCSVCGLTLSAEHSYTGSVTKVPTCTSTGIETYVCSCGHSYTKDIAMKDHTPVNGGTADCHSKCSVCETTLSSVHTYTPSITKEPTCTEEGIRKYACTCGHSYTEDIAVIAHTPVNGGTADCHSKCSECGTVLQNGTKHNITISVAKTPTCTETGLRTYRCDCGYVLTEVIPKVAHTPAKGGTADCHEKCSECGTTLEGGSSHVTTGTVTTVATCTQNGVMTYKCDCGYTYTETITAAGHTPQDGGTLNSHSVCGVCEEILSSTHSFTDSITTTPTCTKAGVRTFACDCGYSYTEAVAATGHTEVVRDGDGTQYSHSKCSVCGETMSTAHAFTTEITTPATDQADGLKTHTCGCGYYYTEVIPMLVHEMEYVGTEAVHSRCIKCGTYEITTHNMVSTVTTQPTCTVKGVRTYSCECGYSYTEDIAPTGHTSVQDGIKGGTEDAHIICGNANCTEVLSSTHDYKSEVTTKATCTTDGLKTYRCDCGYTYTEAITRTGHTEVAGGTVDCHTKCSVCDAVLDAEHSFTSSITTKATCTTPGVETYTCDCGYSYTKEIVATGHTPTSGGTAASHTKCSVCGTSLSSDHNYTSSVTTKATCITAGVETYTCTCGHSYTKTISATGHTAVNGGTEECHKKCSVCGEILDTKHTYTSSITKAPTCTKVGERTYTCDCGYSYTEEVAMIEHSGTAGGTRESHSKCSVCGITLSVAHSYTSAITKEPTCTATGIRTYTCTCGYTYDETIDAAGHKEVNGGSADCHIKCSVCGDIISTEHSYVSTVTKDSTCTTEGERKYTCECGYSYTEVIAAKGHTEVNGGVLASHKKCSVCGDILSTAHSYVSEVTKNPTCTQKGIRTYTCQCGYNYTEDIDEVAHTEVYGGIKASHTYCSVCTLILSNVHSYTSKVTTEATCTTDGVKTYSCECGHSYTEKIGATGHTEVNGGIKDCHKKCSVCGDVLSTAHSYSAKVTTEATCTRDGVKTYTCGCGYSYTEKIGATGHTEVNGGTKDCHKKCSVCGDVLSTAHSYTSEVTKDATEKEEGILTYTCTCGHSYTETIPVLEPSFLYGDVNRDGKVDTKDAVMFKQYLAGMNIDMDLNAADVNIDNKVDTKDVVKLMKYLAGVNGVILGQAD